MNPEKFILMMNELPDEMIDAANPRAAHRVNLESAAVQTLRQSKGARAVSSAEKGFAKQSGAMPRLMTYASLAACAVFAVGVGGILLHGHSDSHPAQISVADSVVLETAPAGAENTDTLTASQKGASAQSAERAEQDSAGSAQAAVQPGEAAQPGAAEAAQPGAAEAAQPGAAEAAQPEAKPLPTIAGRPYNPEIVAQYQPGDINMDGVLTEEDYTLAEQEFQTVVLNGGESILTAEQLALGDIVKDNKLPVSFFNTAFRIHDASITFSYLESYFLKYSSGIPETDYPISKADAEVFYYSFRDRSTETGQFSIEKYLPENVAEINPDAVSPETALIYEPQADEESILFPGFGSVPVHAGEWSMLAYTKAQVGEDYLIMFISGEKNVILALHKIDDPEHWIRVYEQRPFYYQYSIPDSDLNLYFTKKSNDSQHQTCQWIEDSYKIIASSICYQSFDDMFDGVMQLAGIRNPE